MLIHLRHIMAKVIDEAEAEGITLTPIEAYKIAAEIYENENS